MTRFAAEYETALAAAVLFDRSHQGKLELSGKDAPSFLHNLSTNDIKNLPLGGGCEAYFCTSTAKVLAQALIYHVLVDGKHAFALDVTAGFNRKLFEHLDNHLISEAVEIIDTITITEDAEGNVEAVETIEVIEADSNPEGA